MAILFGGSRVNDKTPPATSLRIQTSLNGQPIAIVHGRQRIAGNLIWYDGFRHSGGGSGKSGGGKGGIAGGNKGQSQTSYSADVIIGLCEGPVVYFGTVWSGQTIDALASLGISGETGTQGQPAPGFMTSEFPGAALGYSALAYVDAFPLQLGGSPELPSLNLEIGGTIADAVQETLTIPSSGSPVLTPAYWNLSASVVEQISVPAAAPYQITAQNPYAKTLAMVAAQNQNSISGAAIPGSDSQGVVDVNGRVFARVSGTPASGQYAIANSGTSVTYTFAAADAGLQITIIDLAVSAGVKFTATGEWLTQVLGTPAAGQFSISVQSGSYGQYLFAAADAGKQVAIVDSPDADPSASLSDFLSNARYGCGFPTANIGDLSALQNYAYAAGLFVSPAIVAAQAANNYLKDFATGLNGEFVWSGGLLTFVPYSDVAMSGYGKIFTPPGAPIYTLGDDDFLKNEGAGSVGGTAFTSDDPVVCVRTRPSDAYNDVKVEYLDRGNSYNPAIAEAQDDAAIDLYGLRTADSKQLHFFCAEAPAMVSAQLQLGRNQVRNTYSFTVPWYFILLDPMDIVAISDASLGLDGKWVRIREITENQQDGTLSIVAEEYLQGAASAPVYAVQPRLGHVPNLNAAAASVN